MSDTTLDTLLSRLISQDRQPNLKGVANALAMVAKREDGGNLLRSSLQNGSDPLQTIPPAAMTLQYLFILTARLTGPMPSNVHPEYITTFCQMFDPDHARLAPERITILARCIIQYAEQIGNPEFPLEPLYNLITHFPPSLAYLTTIHPCFLLACIQTRQFAAALPVLTTPIAEVDKFVSDLEYTDVLQYYYLGGVIFGVLTKYAEAEEFLETVVSSPAHTPSAVQLEAYKKLTLIQLIRHGKTLVPPKYTNAALIKQMKAIPQYAAIVRHYPTIKGPITELVQKEFNFFSEEGNLGLVKIVMQYAPRWAVMGLMKTYSSLPVSQVARLVNLPSDQYAQEVILRMIKDGQLSAELLPDGTLVFHEDAIDEQAFSPGVIQAMLLKAQNEHRELQELGQSMAASKQLLARALKERESPYGGGGHLQEDDLEGWRSGGQIAESLFE